LWTTVVDPVDRRPTVRFGPDRRLAALSAAGAVAAAIAAIVVTDPEGRLLAGVAALALLAYTVSDLLFWPRLVASTEGLTVRSPAARVSLSWTDVEAVRVDERSRLGLANRALEIDSGGHLIVLSRRALGADPRDVLNLLSAFDPGDRSAEPPL
jgi:hypothetical protein